MKISIGKFAILIALGVIGFAIYDYKNSAGVENAKLVAARVFGDRVIEDVSSFKIHSVFGDITIENAGTRWQMAVPVRDSADEMAVETYLTSLLNQQMKKVETETEASINWSEYGLDKPDGWVEVTFKDKSHALLQVGTVRAIADGHYLRKDSGDKLYVGDSDWTTLVNRPSGEFRNKSMFDLSGEIKEFSANDLHVQKKNNRWEVKTVQLKFETDQTKVKDFVTVIGNFKVDMVAADNKSELKKLTSEQPYFTFSVKSDKEERKLEFTKGKNGKVYAVSSARDGIFEVSKDKVATLQKVAKDFEVVLNKEKAEKK